MNTGLLFLICCLFAKGSGQCSFPDTLVASWKSSNYGTITIASDRLTLGEHTFNLAGKSSNTVYDVHACNTATNTYVVKSQIEFSSHGETGHAYICFVFTQVTTNSYYFYMNSLQDSIFNNERMNFWATTAADPNLQVCNGVSGNPSTAEFNSMLRLDSSSAVSSDITTSCPTPLLGNFSYVLTSDTGTTTTCADTILNTCYGRQTISIDYTVCATTTLYSSGGQLGCISSIQDGSTYYAGLYNYDASPDKLTTFEFICVAVTSDGDVTLTASKKRCVSSQTSTTSNLQKLVLTSYFTCPYTEDSINVLAIVLGVLFGLLFLALLALLIYCCCKKKKKRDKIKANTARNLKIFEKKMAMDEFDDEHPLNESSLVPDFPQNGYPEPLKLAPRGKKYTMPQVIDAEIQTERSSITDMESSRFSNRGFGNQKDFHNSSRSLATQRDFESQTDRSTDVQRSLVNSHNKALKNKIPGEKQNQEFPSEPQFLPWPWRTANRAMKTNTTSVKSGAPSYNSNTNGLPDLGEFMIKNYNIKYDDTLSSVNTHPPPRRLSRSQSIHHLERPPTRMLEMKKTYSHEQLNRSKTSMAGEYPTPRTLLRSMSHNDVMKSKHNYNHFQHKNKPWDPPPSKANAPSRRASVASIKSVLQRSNTRMLKTIRESKERIPTPLKSKKKPHIPAYMRPLTRAKTLPPANALKKAANVYGKRPTTGKLIQNARSLLQTKLKHKNMEKPVRKKRKVLRKKRSSWKSPFALPSSLPPRPISLRSVSRIKHSKIEPIRSYRSSTTKKDSISSRDFPTTDEITSDSTGENFLDSEIPRLPALVSKPKVSVETVKKEKTFRMDKKRIISEDSGISADDSASSKDDDDTRFPLPDIIETSNILAPGQLKPPPRRQHNPWR